MTTLSSDHLTNHHDGLFGRLAKTLHVWRERQQARQDLSHLSELELHDFGLSISEATYEADKPFWRA